MIQSAHRQRLRLLCGVSIAAFAAFSAGSAALAEETDDTTVDALVVVGQRAMMQTSVSRQRESDTVESVESRDAIGQFPDQNVAEAARRLPGVNVLDDQGEGRFVSVRGLDPSLNAASVNDVRLPAPEADTRAVALDVIPSELVESISIKKTLTADMDADTLGASIDIKTTRSFDRQDPFFGAIFEGSYNDLNGKTSPKGSLDFSVPVSDVFGIAGGLSYYKRQTSTDNQEMSGWKVSTAAGSAGVVYADTVEYRDYDVERTRLGGSLSFDLRAGDSTTLYARLLISKFNDSERRQRLTFSLQGQPVSGDGDTATFLSSTSAGTGSRRIRVRRDLKDRYEAQSIQSYQIGGETDRDLWNFKYSLSWSEADEHEHHTTDPTRFQRDVTANGALGVTFDYSRLRTTSFLITAGLAGFSDPANYKFTERDSVNGLSRDEEWAGKFDFTRTLSEALDLKGGVKVRIRQKTYSANNQIYTGFSGSYTLADVPGSQSYGLAQLGVLPSLGAVRAFNRDNQALFVLNSADSIIDSKSGAYNVHENIFAGYLEGRYKAGPTTVIAGVRFERTEDDLAGNTIVESPLSVTPTSYSRSYSDWLPSVNVRYEATDKLLLRAGVYASVVRPGIGQFAPKFSINADDEGEFGNPALDPYRAWNYDLSVEYYFSRGSVVQVGLFYKDIRDFIVTKTYDKADAPYFGVYNGIAFDTATIPINGNKATVQGLEFSYQQALTFLPAPFDGLLASFNYTYTDAEGDVPLSTGTGTRSIPLVAASKSTYNAVLGYEKGPVSLRFTAAYRDKYLDELGAADDGLQDRYVKDHLQFDASAKYRISRQFQVYAEFVNLNNEPYLAYQRGPGRDRLLQYETYSWTGKFGLRYTY